MRPSNEKALTMMTKPMPGRWSPPGRPAAPQPDVRPTIVTVLSDADLQRYTLPAFNRLPARTAAEAIGVVARERPRALVLDADLQSLDAAAFCRGARAHVETSVLVITSVPERVPAVLKAGCHAILLKPFAPNLLAARLGRLVRERAIPSSGDDSREGTNHAWLEVCCPKCGTAGAVGFEFTSHRRMWFACLKCEHVWIGARQE